MRSRAQLKARASELKDEVAKATAANEDGRIEAKRFKGFIDKAYRENEEIQDELKQWDQAKGTLTQVTSQFADTPAGHLAQQRLDKMATEQH